jgi:hypothetical protein
MLFCKRKVGGSKVRQALIAKKVIQDSVFFTAKTGSGKDNFDAVHKARYSYKTQPFCILARKPKLFELIILFLL